MWSLSVDEDVYEMRHGEAARPVPTRETWPVAATDLVPGVFRRRERGELREESGAREGAAHGTDDRTSRAGTHQHRRVPVVAPVRGLWGARHRRSGIRPSRQRQGRGCFDL